MSEQWEARIYVLENEFRLLLAERDEWKVRAEKAEAEIVRMRAEFAAAGEKFATLKEQGQ